jgi:hypothetical protein
MRSRVRKLDRSPAAFVLGSDAKRENAMVDLASYQRSLESDLKYVREKLAMLEAGTMQSGVRKEGHEWLDVTPRTILLYKRMIVTYEASLNAVKAKLAQGS